MAVVELGTRTDAAGSTRSIASLARSLRASRPLQVVFAVGSIVFLLVILGTVLLLEELRAREMKEARRGLTNLNAALAEGSRLSLQSVDLVLRGIVDEMRQEGVASADDFRRLKSGRDSHDGLRAKLSGLPQLNAISFVDPDGRLVNFSRTFPTPPIELRDRDHFQELLKPDPSEPYVSVPIENRGSGEWTVYLARRVLGPTGQLAGLVYAAIELRYFQDFYRSLDIGRDSSVSLWRMDGTLLVHHPSFEVVGRRFDSPAFQDLTPASPPMIFETKSLVDRQHRIVARRVVSDFPVVAVVSRTKADVLHEWRTQTIVFGVAGAIVAAAVLAVVGALARQFWAYEAMGAAVRERAAALQDRGVMEAQLRQSQKLEAMGQLTSGVAHDFNNLLTVILGNLDLLARRLTPDVNGLKRYVDGARGGAERASGLTQRLLAFSRRQALEPQPLDVNALVRGMEDLLSQTLGDNMTLALDLAPDLERSFADPNQLEAALLNLVVNARDAMPGGGTVTVETRNREGGGDAFAGQGGAHVALTVQDTGTGMSPAVAQRAFEPFFTTKEPGVGTGLGLAQVYGFVKQSAGDVAIDTAEGGGTRITLALPRHRPAASAGLAARA